MSIVRWTTPNVTPDMITTTPETLIKILSWTPYEMARRWEGRLIYKPKAKNTFISVELRKQISGCNMVIKIHDRNYHGAGSKLVQITMSQGVQMTVDDLSEMNTAIDEGIAMYRHPAMWLKLNEFRDNKRKEAVI